MSLSSDASPGPSRTSSPRLTVDSLEEQEEEDNPKSIPSDPASSSSINPNVAEEGDEEGDEGRMDIKLLQGFADKVQRHPSGSTSTQRVKVIIPKRGEKDFEPLKETVNLQEMMLQRSREALFNALGGVRGGANKSVSHALLTPSSRYPLVLIARGHLLNSMGITVRGSTASTKGKGRVELLPEEALYLLERGSLQIWIGREAETEEDVRRSIGQWKDEEYGVGGAIEMGVMEGFGMFIGKEGLTWERYQAYAYLQRLGYTVQRARRFLPAHFTDSASSRSRRLVNHGDENLAPFRTWWMSIPRWITNMLKSLARLVYGLADRVASVGLRLGLRLSNEGEWKGTLLQFWGQKTYPSLFAHLRVIPSTHSQRLPPRPPIPQSDLAYDALESNPYLPFWTVWKPAAPWSKAKWDRGSEAGLDRQRPDYMVAVVEARCTALPTIHQLAEVFDELPNEPTGRVKKLGPQYERKSPTKSGNPFHGPERTLFERLGWKAAASAPKPRGNPMGALRNGDRALIVAVNDSGNTGWVRFGRTGFAGLSVI